VVPALYDKDSAGFYSRTAWLSELLYPGYGIHLIVSSNVVGDARMSTMDEAKTSPRSLLGSFISWHFKSRRLEDRIRELCAKALVTTEPAELSAVLEELTNALHVQVERLRKQATVTSLPAERRFSRT
jgi:hypothetical protein